MSQPNTAGQANAGAIGGIAFAVCSIAGGALLPQPPAPTATAAKLHDYFAEHHGALLAGSTLAAFAALALLPFLAALRTRLGSSKLAADTAFGAGSALVACAVLGALLQAGLTHVAGRLDSLALVAAYGLERMVFYIAPPFLVVALAGAVASASVRLPGWLRGLSWLLSGLAAIAAVAGVLATSAAGTAIGFGGFLLTIVWTVCVSVVVLRSAVDAPARQPVEVHA